MTHSAPDLAGAPPLGLVRLPGGPHTYRLVPNKGATGSLSSSTHIYVWRIVGPSIANSQARVVVGSLRPNPRDTQPPSYAVPPRNVRTRSGACAAISRIRWRSVKRQASLS